MSKIWIVTSNTSFSKKQKIYKSESSLLKAIKNYGDQEIFEYDLVSSLKATDYLKSKSRDSQLKSVLGELDDKEESIIKMIAFYKEHAPNGKEYKTWRSSTTTRTQKQDMLVMMEKYQFDKKAFAQMLVSNKRYFMTVMNDVN
jgi:hypothetical protein